MISGGAAALGLYLWPLGQQAGPVGWIAVTAAVMWLVSLRNLNAGLRAWDLSAVMHQTRRRGAVKRSDIADAEWADWTECKKGGLAAPGGLFLGTLEKGKRELFYRGEGSMVVFGGPGQGKSTSCAAQQILRLSKKSSAVVLDLKLELWACFSKDLRRRGFDVKLVNPWFESFNEEFDGALESHDDGYDPCIFLDANRSSIIDDCKLLASLLIGGTGGQANETEEFFRAFATDILLAFLLYLLDGQGSVTLPELRSALLVPQDEIEASIEAMEQSSAFSGVLAEYGARLAGPYVRAPKEFSGGMSGALNALSAYDAHSPLARSVGRDAKTDPRMIKHRPTVIFFAIPAEKVTTHAAWLGLCMTSTMELIARDRRNKPVIAIIDEAQNLPPSVGQKLLKGIALYRGVGLRFVLCVQFVAALQRLVGPTWREILGVDVVALYGSTNDLETLKLFSELIGEETVRTHGTSSNPEQVGPDRVGLSLSTSEHARPLVRPSEIRMLETGRQLLLVKNLKPLLAWKQSYLDVWHLRRRASKNPYYRK